MMNVAINGLGRVGRIALKLILEEPEINLVAVNDLTSLENMVYLLRYDSVYGRYQKELRSDDANLHIDGKIIRAFSRSDPATLPWADLNIDLVFECTGAFRTRSDLEKHIKAGSKRVILSAPGKGGNVPSVVYGVNDIGSDFSSCFSAASCTTNCIAPVVEIMHRHFGIKKAMFTTIHAYTSSQGVIDMPNKNMERGRAAGLNIIPTSTGAASATVEVLPEHKGHIDGLAIRVPIATGSISDITFVTERSTSIAQVNDAFRQESRTPRYEGVVGVTEDPIVSSDIIADPRAAIIDLHSTRVVDGDLVKVYAWYDNEWGYVNQLIKSALNTCSRKDPA